MYGEPVILCHWVASGKIGTMLYPPKHKCMIFCLWLWYVLLLHCLHASSSFFVVRGTTLFVLARNKQLSK